MIGFDECLLNIQPYLQLTTKDLTINTSKLTKKYVTINKSNHVTCVFLIHLLLYKKSFSNS